MSFRMGLSMHAVLQSRSGRNDNETIAHLHNFTLEVGSLDAIILCSAESIITRHLILCAEMEST
jgi:hypothetical protein